MEKKHPPSPLPTPGRVSEQALPKQPPSPDPLETPHAEEAGRAGEQRGRAARPFSPGGFAEFQKWGAGVRESKSQLLAVSWDVGPRECVNPYPYFIEFDEVGI